MGCSPSTPRKECINVTAMRSSYNTQVEAEKGQAVDRGSPPAVSNVKPHSVASPNTNQSDDLPTGGNTNGEKVIAKMAEQYQMQKNGTSISEVCATVTNNDFSEAMTLPNLDYPHAPVDFPFISAYSNAKWPIPCFAPLDMSVNAYHGGCAGIMQCSNQYGGKGEETTAQLFLYRGGFSGNYFSRTSLMTDHSGHFGCRNVFDTDENGRLIPNLMFGHNQVSLITSDPRHGNLSHGILVEATSDNDETTLPLDVNGQRGAGNTIVVCSGWESGSGEAARVSALYMVRSGFKDNFQKAKLLKGDDKWSFGTAGAFLNVKGPTRSVYAIYHNSTSNIDVTFGGTVSETEPKRPLAGHTQAVTGNEEIPLLDVGTASCSVVVMCSSSSGDAEDATAAALYLLTLGADGGLKAVLVESSVGSHYTQSTGDLWTFQEDKGKVTVKGPEGPCRYGYISNVPRDTSMGGSQRTVCLASGEDDPVQGAAHITNEQVVGWVNKRTDVKITIDKDQQLVIPDADLNEVKPGTFAFAHHWSKKEKEPGLRLISVDAERKSVIDGTPHAVPLTGSPRKVTWQPPGVVYALNCGGQAYEALDGIIYGSEFSEFANFSKDVNFGSQCLAGGTVKPNAQIPQLVAGTEDGFMFAQDRTPWPEAVDEKHVNYEVKNLPNGSYTLRLNTVYDTFSDLSVNGKRVQSQVDPQLKRSSPIPGATARSAHLPVTVSDNTLKVFGRNYCISSFALLDKSFKPKQRTSEEQKLEETVKKQLADKVDPLDRTMTRKERKLVGWSPNLLINSSAELDNMSGWNISGNWAIHGGGHGTEKAFKTSHMWCSKSQQVVLTQHCSAEYLDTAPTIQVSEWYREGVCGGGHYYFKAALLDADGNILKEHVLPETGRIYRNNEWSQESVTFKDYGPGVRAVYLETRGKDDKYWGGHYGIIMSAAVVRVKRETKIAENDRFEDITQGDSPEGEKELAKDRDQLVSQVLTENEELLQRLIEEQVLSETDGEARLAHLGHMKRPQARKKREIRVFVSSTFRDFTQEREELIKKTFREVNMACASRGVFFTYVDLRWGITEEQTNHGKTIAICLQEIDRCRPYFICMMGDRYGWAEKEEKPDKLLDASFTYAIENFPNKFSWIDEYRKGTSVTKLEVLHGALNDIEKSKDRSFFYLRDTVQPGEMDEKLYNRMVAESDWHKDRQANLRRMVEEKPELKRRRYKKPLDVCEKIKKDLLWCLDEDFPLGTELTPLEREREAHIAFAEARRQVYIGREDYFTTITDFTNQKLQTPFVILGESGSGKSALVANWVGRMEDALPNAFIFVHFIGSSAESASYIKLLRRLYEEMKQFYGFEMAVPQSDQDLTRSLGVWLRMAGAVPDTPCVVVLDALNQLDSGTGPAGAEHDLLWIPRRLPPGVTLVLSTLPGRAMDAVSAAGWPHMRVEPLKESEKLQVVSEYLEGIYGKHLNDEQKDMIVSSPQTNNPLYLKALLDEVRMFGSFRLLTAKIQEYLQAQNPPELFATILSRFEEDFERGQHTRPGLVRQMASAIWCSHKGLSEAELLDHLQIPSPVWSPFYLSIVDNLVNRNGILNFFHDHLRQAVEAKYLPTAADKKAAYIELADYFSQRPVDDRVAEELPFLLTHADELDRLKACISDLSMFTYLVKTEEGKFDLIKAWTLLGSFSQAEEVYIGELAKVKEEDMTSDALAQLRQNLAEFFMDLGLFGAARTILEDLVTQLTKKYTRSHSVIVYDAYTHKYAYLCKHPVIIDILHKLGSVCEKQKDFEPALDYFRKAIHLQNNLYFAASKLQLTEGLLGQATVLYLKEDMMASKRFLLRAQELATDVLGHRHHYVAAIINKLGQVSYKQGRLEEALGYYLQDLRLTRADVGLAHPRVAGVLNDVALVYDDNNDPRAGRFYEAALHILLATYGGDHLDVAVVRYNLGAFYFAMFSFARAQFQFTEAIKVYEQFFGADHPDTQEAKTALEEVSAFL